MSYKLNVTKEGFDKKQVKELVSSLDAENHELLSEVKFLKSKIEELSKEFTQFTTDYKNLYDKFEKKDDLSLQVTRTALKEANDLVQQAKENSDFLIEEALKKVNMITNDAMKIKTEVAQFKNTIKILAFNIIEAIKESEFLIEEGTINKREIKNQNTSNKLKKIIAKK